MFEFTESVLIDAPRDEVWGVLSDIDRWWLASNPEHDSLEHLDSGQAVGTIIAVEPGTAVTWEADARYRWLGVPVRIGEGVTWRVEPYDDVTTQVSARVWATLRTASTRVPNCSI